MEVWNIIRDTIVNWGQEAVELTPNIIAAFVVILLFWVFSLLVPKAADGISSRVFKRKQLKNLFKKLIRFLILAIGIVVALNVLRLDQAVTSFLAGLGIAGLAIGFAFQEIITNFISGVIIVVNTPFRIGDVIRTTEVHGIVKGVKLRTTHIHSFDGKDVLVPNKSILQNVLVNESKLKERRVDLEVGVDYESDLRLVEKVARKAVKKLHDVDAREIEVLFHTFDSSSINLSIRFWINFESQLDFLKKKSAAIILINDAFRENEINMPFPTQVIKSQ